MSTFTRRITILLIAGSLPTLSALLGIVSTPPASAHADFINSTPSDGAVLDNPPTSIDLTFSEDIDPNLSSVGLRAGDTQYGQLDLTRGNGPGTVTAALPDSIRSVNTQAEWLVGYRVLSVDGHTVAGTVTFSVAAEDPVAAEAPSPSDVPSSLASGSLAPGASPGVDDLDDRDNATSPPGAVDSDSATDSATNSAGDTAGAGAVEEYQGGWWVPVGVLVLVTLGALAARRLGRSENDETPSPESTSPPQDSAASASTTAGQSDDGSTANQAHPNSDRDNADTSRTQTP